jgi:hypothetical protein
MATYRRYTTKDWAGVARTVTLELESEDERWIKGWEVGRSGTRRGAIHLIDASTVTRRQVMVMDPHYGELRPDGAS